MYDELILLDADGLPNRALARQQEWCGANRIRPAMDNNVFPHDTVPLVISSAGTEMRQIYEAAKRSQVAGKVGFALEGCLLYHFSFDKNDSPNHETRFLYILKNAKGESYISPAGDPSGFTVLSP